MFDFIVNALPHNSSTNKLFDYQYFNKFKSNSIYLNVGRKQTTSQKDLVKWLVSSKSRGIYLDVYDDSITFIPTNDINEVLKLVFV